MSLQACRKVRRGLNKYGLQIAITVHIIRINLLLLLALLVRGLRVIACVLRMLLGLRRMFLALCMVILAVRISGSAMRLRCRFVMLGRLVVRVFHRVFSLLANECRLLSTWLLTEASTTGQRQWNKEKAALPLFDRSSAAQSSRPRTDRVKFPRDTQSVVRQEQGSASRR
jgi:hypothetical protein